MNTKLIIHFSNDFLRSFTRIGSMNSILLSAKFVPYPRHPISILVVGRYFQRLFELKLPSVLSDEGLRDLLFRRQNLYIEYKYIFCILLYLEKEPRWLEEQHEEVFKVFFLKEGREQRKKCLTRSPYCL